MLLGSQNSDAESSAPTVAQQRSVGIGTICLLLAVLTIGVYYRVVTFDFIPFDDNKYVYENPRIKQGLTFDNFTWGLTTGYFAIWHPLTWWSYLLDGQWFGARPGPMHAVNLLFHLVNTLLLFGVLRRLTGDERPSAFVAAVFALHPLHVEPVAWVSGRKDVLNACFWLLTLWTYVRYVQQPSRRRYGLICAALTAALLAKTMAITLPFVLLLLDYWPLRRFNPDDARKARRIGKLTAEKLPLFALAAGAAVASYWAARQGGAMGDDRSLTLPMRLVQAAQNYVVYLAQTFWPAGLEAYYLHPRNRASFDPTTWYAQGFAAALFLFLATGVVLKSARRQPHLAVGWLWFLGTLVPVCGLMQVGGHVRADRYTYVPQIGLAIMAAWGVPELLRRTSQRTAAAALLGAATIAACLTLTWRQVGHWRNGVTLGTQLVAVDETNYKAHSILANSLARAGKLDEALAHNRRAAELAPPDSLHAAALLNQCGAVCLMQRNYLDGERYLRAALTIHPHMREAHYNLGNALAQQGKFESAKAEYLEALRIEPSFARAHNHLGLVYLKQEQTAEAATHFRAALDLDPSFDQARSNLYAALQRAN